MIINVTINDLNEKQPGSLKGVSSQVNNNTLDDGMFNTCNVVKVHLDIAQ